MTSAAGAPSARRLAGGTVLLLAVRTSGLVMGIVVVVLLARGLPAESFGTFATGLALVQIGSAFTDFGLGALLVREGTAAPALRRSMLLWGVRARLLFGTLVFFVLAAVTVVLVAGTDGRRAVLLICATLPVNAFTMGMTLLQQRLLLRRMALLLLAQSVLWLAAVAALYSLHAGLWGYAAGYLAFNVVYAGLVHREALRSIDGASEHMDWRAFARAMRDVVPLSITAMLITLYYKLDSVFVFHYAGASAAASYAVAYRFLDQLQVVPVTLSNVFLPLLTRSRSAGLPSRPTFERYVRLTLLLTVPVVGVGLIAAVPLVVGVFGAEYRDSVVLLRLLLPAFVPVSLGYVMSYLAIVHRQSRKQLVAAAVALTVNVGCNVVLVPRYGAPAAATITLLTECAAVSVLYLTLRGPCAVALPWAWLGRFGGVVAVAGGSGAAVGSVQPLAGGAVFAAMYIGAAWLFHAVDRDEIAALLKKDGPASDGAVEQASELVPEMAGPEH